VDCPRYHQELGTLVEEKREAQCAIACPNNHNQAVKFTHETVLKSGTLVFHCNTCDTNWSPSAEVIATFRKQFAKSAS
jgi:hypothetical protein